MPKAPLLTDWVALVNEGFNPDDIGYREYAEMLQRSSTVRYAYDYVRRNVARRIGEYHHDDPRVAEWVEAQVMPAVHRHGTQMLSALYWGMCLAEPLWAPDGDTIQLEAIYVANPETWFNGGQPVRDKDTTALTGWRLGLGGGEVPFYNRGYRQIAHWAVGSDHDNAWGDPIARRCFPHHLFLKQFMMWEGIGAEVSALARLVLLYQGDDEDRAAELAQSIAHLGTNGAVALSATDVQQVIQIGGQFTGGASPFNDPIRRHVNGVFAAWGMPPMVHSGDQKFGNRSQADTQLEAYIGAETALAEDYADRLLLHQIIGPAVELQFGKGTPAGDLCIRDAAPPELAQWATILSQLYTVGAFDPQCEEHLRFVEERFGLPMAERIEEIVALPGIEAQGETAARRPGEPQAMPEVQDEEDVDPPDAEEVAE